MISPDSSSADTPRMTFFTMQSKKKVLWFVRGRYEKLWLFPLFQSTCLSVSIKADGPALIEIMSVCCLPIQSILIFLQQMIKSFEGPRSYLYTSQINSAFRGLKLFFQHEWGWSLNYCLLHFWTGLKGCRDFLLTFLLFSSLLFLQKLQVC